MPSNNAAWLTAKGKPLEIRPAPYTPPEENEIVIKNAVVAVNPVDNVMQDLAYFSVNYPAILGLDVAGTVVEVGKGASRFKVGDRVLGHAIGFATRQDKHSAFQEYTVLISNMSSPIPDNLPFERAVVIPVGLSTASSGLFQKGFLELDYPLLEPKSNGKTLLVWGGASSVGSSSIQLAVASGYEVLATASPKNFDLVKKLGASQVFDYNSTTVVKDIVVALDGRELVGVFDSISRDTVDKVLEIVTQSQGRASVVTTLSPPAAEKIPAGVSIKHTRATEIKDNEISKVIYEDFLPKALAAGKYVPALNPYVAGNDLESVQAGMDIVKKGVSATKVVIALSKMA